MDQKVQYMKPCFICQFPLDHLSLLCLQVGVEYLAFLPHFTFTLKAQNRKQFCIFLTLANFGVFHLPVCTQLGWSRKAGTGSITAAVGPSSGGFQLSFVFLNGIWGLKTKSLFILHSYPSFCQISSTICTKENEWKILGLNIYRHPGALLLAI